MSLKMFNIMMGMPTYGARPSGMVYGGGKGGGGVVEKPVYVPPPAAPAMTEAATQEDAVTPEEEERRVREAQKQGTKSLQIPVTGGGGATNTVGTGTSTS